MVWAFVGSVGCTIIIYILPPVFYLRVRVHPDKPDLKQISALLLLVCGVFMLGAGSYQSIMNIICPIVHTQPSDILRNVSHPFLKL